jgi:uncharacterized membrane protein
VSRQAVQLTTLIGATGAMGLMAGVFGIYANAIMRGLAHTDDRTFVGAFQSIDRAIINPLFMLTFLGALVLSGVAALVHRGGDATEVVPWAAAAFGLYLGAVVITMAVHVPLNDAIKAAGDPNTLDVSAVRSAVHESRWIVWNVVRTVLTTAAFSSLMWALVLNGRGTADAPALGSRPAHIVDSTDSGVHQPRGV